MSESAVLRLQPDELASGRPYVERDERPAPWHDEVALWLWHSLVIPAWAALGGPAAGARRVVAMAATDAAALAALDDDALRAQAHALRAELRRSSLAARPAARCFAIVREAAQRVLGKRHYDSQLHAAWLLLQGTLAEMATGEGKSLAATLPACAAALAGLPVHVVTVNDYLAERDALVMAPLYRFFGLRCAAAVHGQSRAERRAVYSCEIVYCSNKELTFDYLRDRVALGDRGSPLHRAVAALNARHDAAPETVLRGLAFAIVDEADSVFIDEARTPLILSATIPGGGAPQLIAWALARASQLREGPDYTVERAQMRIRLSDARRQHLEDDAERAAEQAQRQAAGQDDPHPGSDAVDDAAPPGTPLREAIDKLTQALAALHLYHRDQQYVVIDDKVQIVDESTGRVMPDRSWERGLHQLIEAKEGLPFSGERATLARITYQRFFRRYLRVAGMSGTATEVAAEIGRVYRLPVAPVPLHRPRRWTEGGARCLADDDTRWAAVVDSVRRHAVQGGRPVLVGTRTVRASETLSARLTQAGIAHVVLNAKQDQEEAAIIARAGEAGAVTVATNMAGRGTDIALGPGVVERGGLHVILSEYHDSARVDRQLFGRAARQGDPGSGESIVGIDDELFVVHAPRATALLRGWMARRGTLPAWALWLLRRLAQASAEAGGRNARMASLSQDRRLASLLAFSGRGE